MGCYSYICNECKKNIIEGEKVHLFHMRHGKILGEAVGTYNAYGSVIETEGYDNKYFDRSDVDDTNPNCHEEIMTSSLFLNDSSDVNEERKHEKLYKGEVVTKNGYHLIRIKELEKEGKVKEALLNYKKIWKEFKKLPSAPMIEAKSGVVAFHKYCYDCSKKPDMSPSERDTKQGCGTPRKEYL